MAGKGEQRKVQQQGAQRGSVIVITDADYRSITLPCDALEESEGPAREADPALVTRAAGR